MPSYRRPHTAPSAGHSEHSFDGLEKGLRTSQWTRVDADWFARGRELEQRKHAVPTAYAEFSTSDEDSIESRTHWIEKDEESRENSLQQTVTPPLQQLPDGTPKLRRTTKRVITPPHLISGLPPTPPTMANSEDAEPRSEGLASNPQFADAVRNALHTQEFISSARGQQLPSPDLTPPAISEAPVSPPSPSRRASFMQPLRALRLRPSSRTDSFHTARETQTPGASQTRLVSDTPSPEPQSTSPWLSFLSEDPYSNSTGAGSRTLSHRPSHLSHISEISGLSSDTPTPTPLRPRKRAHSPSPCRPLTPDEDELDRHISYIGDQQFEELSRPSSPIHSDSDMEEHVSYISDHTHDGEDDTEHVNNLVYKHIQEENVKRHSAVIEDGAMPVGVWFPEPNLKEHRLRRTTKAESLRNVSGTSDVNSQQESVDGSAYKRLRHKKATIPSRSYEALSIVGSAPFARPQTPPRSIVAVEMTSPTPSMIDRETMARLNFDPPNMFDLPSVEHTKETMPGQERTLRLPRRLEQPTLPTLRHSSAPMPPLRNFRQHSDAESAVDAPLPTRQHSPPRIVQHKLRHFSHEAKLENNSSVHRTSLDASSSLRTRTSVETPPNISGLALSSPGRKSFDTKLLRPSHTPHISTSQLSAWSEAEVCEAQGVKIYPHTNHSLLVVQHGSSPLSVDSRTPTPPQIDYLGLSNYELGIGQLLYGSSLREPTPPEAKEPPRPQAKEICQRVFAADSQEPPSEPKQELSPLPRQEPPTFHLDTSLMTLQAASVPPMFQVIPPTPSEEIDQQLDTPRKYPPRSSPSPKIPQRRLSLRQKARRFSESYIEQPLFGRSFSGRKEAQSADVDVDSRPTHLSPMWRPNDLWSGYESEEDAYLLNEYELERPASARLPRGGDISETEEREREERRQGGPLPRNLSVRMPGFRGDGGFHVGNSLGLDRHGTNNRRHHVVVRKTSVGGGFGCTGNRRIGYVGELRSRSSKEMIRRRAGLRLPWGRGRRLQFVGLTRARRRVETWRAGHKGGRRR